MSGSVGVTSRPLRVASVLTMMPVEAPTEGASLVPLMVRVRMLAVVPPWPSETTKVKESVSFSPTPRPCTAGSPLFSL